MNTSVEISLYPLTADYEPIIIDFIKSLRSWDKLAISTNGLSTQLCGPFDEVMQAMTEAMRPVMAGEPSCSFVIKALNVAVAPGQEVKV